MSRPEHHLNLNYLPQITATQPHSGSSTADTSPIEPPQGSARSPFGLPSTAMNGSSRLGAGSPSHELGSGRLYSKRAREIQAQEGLTTPNLWGPPTSGGSTPLRETIPESPSQDGFPDFVPPAEQTPQFPQRARAGTVPSRLSPGNGLTGLTLPTSLAPKTSRPTPSTSPFRPLSATHDNTSELKQSSSPTASTLLSRLRAGSMPQRSSLMNSSNPFGTSLFSPWGTPGRDRGNTLASIRSSEGADSPAQSHFSKDSLADTDVKTLDYLGLAEPQQSRASFSSKAGSGTGASSSSVLPPFFTDLASYNKNWSRYRSYSVNAKEKYAEDEEDEYGLGRYSGLPSGTLTPSAASAAAALAATQAQIHQHNLAVQAFATQASASRPRARTAGVLDSPLRNTTRGFLTPSRLETSIIAADFGSLDNGDVGNLADSVKMLRMAPLSEQQGIETTEETGLEGPTRALWLGSIPTSTTVSSLQAIFGPYGKIESARVLVQKNCGFVNFEEIESAVRAKANLNGKEIFPGAGPVRIGYAKVPSSASGTPGHYGVFPSPSPDPQSKGSEVKDDTVRSTGGPVGQSTEGSPRQSQAAAVHVPDLPDLRDEILRTVREFGASEKDVQSISETIDSAIGPDQFKEEIRPITEPSHTRVHDAPKLRDIRKRIDNNAISPSELEEIAMGMLPEIAELSSDYLGNTVVQKLFEFCSEPTKEAMLERIAPHLAEIGIHKNGTWAAQKIIDVAKTNKQYSLIVSNLRPYTAALFLDQYGNYVLQCCLRFGYPWNSFIFETMLNQLWEVAQGRFGARAMRACLESHHSTKDQQRMLASAIALHSVQLATNANGALLLTWFLDTCTFPRRRFVLTPKLIPHLVHLCTHKVAYLTVLKVINQRNEPDARDTLLQALFLSKNDKTLEDILSDQACGATLIFKVLTTPFFDDNLRTDVVQQVKTVLTRLKVQHTQSYKRLMDEVGLSTRSGGKGDRDRDHAEGNGNYHERLRPVSQPGIRSNHPVMERSSSGQFATMSAFNAGPAALAAGLEPTPPFDQFNINSPVFSPTAMATQQLQYQNALLASARNISPTSIFTGYPTPSASYDNYRPSLTSPMGPQAATQLSPTPMMQGSAGFPPPGFPMMAAGYQGFPHMPYYPQQLQQQSNNGRRGRASQFDHF